MMPSNPFKIIALVTISFFGVAQNSVTFAQTDGKVGTESKVEAKEGEAELQFIKDSLGVWDVKATVWANGLDKEPMKFEGVETNRGFGKHWLASDLDTVFAGQKMSVHSIVGYDLDKKKLVGTVIDHGPYSASMTGSLDVKNKTIKWITKAKMPSGAEMIQHTTVKHVSKTKRILTLNTKDQNSGESRKFMEIVYTKRVAKEKPLNKPSEKQ